MTVQSERGVIDDPYDIFGKNERQEISAKENVDKTDAHCGACFSREERDNAAD